MKPAHRTAPTILLTAFAFATVVAGAIAQVRPTIHPIAPPSLSTPSLRPIALPSARSTALPTLKPVRRYVGVVAPGTRVPFSRLPMRPLKSLNNTVGPKQTGKLHHYRPMAATGATFALTPGSTCGSTGALYNVGCVMGWNSTGNSNWSSGDTYQDYVIEPNSTTAVACSVALCGRAGAYTGATGPTNSTTMSVAGTWMFGTYDTTAQVWINVIYLNAGQSFTIGVYQDAYHTTQSYQFDIASNPVAYVYLTNVAPSDRYVVYAMSTGVNAYCVWMSPTSSSIPSPSPRPSGSANSLVCNPSAVTGVQAPGGDIAATWNLSSSLETGNYSIVVFDQSANNGAGQALGQVEVSLTGTGSQSMVLNPVAPAAPSPAAPATPATTTFAWDSTSEQSDGGVMGTVQNVPSGTYTMTITDPDGVVVGSTTATVASGSTVASASLNFDALSSINSPSQYPSNVWAMQLYSPATKQVLSSQSFKVIGYSSETQFVASGGAASNVLNIPCDEGNGNCYYQPTGTYNTVQAGMKFTNTSNDTYPNNGDSIAGIIYSSGNSYPAAFTSPPPDTGQDGVFFTLNAETTPAPISACTTLCAEVVLDTNGSLWFAFDTCSNGTTVNLTGECLLTFSPVVAGTVLPPGASVSIDPSKMTWYAQSGNPSWACHTTSCQTATTILPQHGITWSGTASGTPAYTPALIGSQINTPPPTSTASVQVIGSLTCDATCSTASTSRSTPAPPVPGIHYYRLNMTQSDYQPSTPFQAASGREDILEFTINSCSGCYTKFAIGFPPNFTMSSVHVDAYQPNGWVQQTCPSNFGPQYICLGNGGNAATIPLYLDAAMPVSSFTAQEFTVQGLTNNGANEWLTFTNTGTTTSQYVGNDSPATQIDSLAFLGYSLNSNLMSASFQPGTVTSSSNPTQFTLQFTNTTSSGDPNPDPVDAIVLEQVTNKNWTLDTSITPTFTTSGWSNLSGTGYNVAGNALEYWFGVCASQYNTAAGPPQTPPNPISPSSIQTAVPFCSATQEQNALGAGGTQSITFDLNGAMTPGTQTFYVYAHGVNGGGWSAPKAITVTLSPESATGYIYSVNGTAVANGSQPTVNNSPNTLVYSISNTSATTSISTVNITLPAFDTSGSAATDGTNGWTLTGTPITSNIKVGTISGGTFTTTGAPAGCTVNTTNTTQTSPGVTNGQIQISGCTGFTPGKTLAVQFITNSPLLQGDNFLFPSTVDSITTGQPWIGANEVEVLSTIGLSVTVDPSNPGPGYSTPIVNCSGSCTFAGATLDFPSISANSSATATDAGRATVIYTGGCSSSCSTWTLQVSGSGTSAALNELTTSVDASNSTQGAGISIPSAAQSYFTLPSAPNPIAEGPEEKLSKTCSGGSGGTYCYDILQNYRVTLASDTSGQTVTIVYTLVAN